MHITTIMTRPRNLIAAMLMAGALITAAATLPAGGHSLAANFAPASAQAAEGGVDGDHIWVKITNGEIAAGLANTICRRFAGPIGPIVCPRLADIARDIVGSAGGVWAEIYNDAHYEYGTW
jgi:hypothetical protein